VGASISGDIYPSSALWTTAIHFSSMHGHYHKRRFDIDKLAGCTIQTSFKHGKWKGEFLTDG
jgi:hypothetical protein